MNLLDQFVLKHMQTSVLRAELLKIGPETGVQEARVELNLTPRLLESEKPEALPGYQVSCRLNCESVASEGDSPAFKAVVGMEMLYQQVEGEAIDVSTFTNQHASLARQIYPLLQHEMRGLLTRLGLTQIQLPFDLIPRRPEGGSGKIEVSSAVH